MADQPTSQQLMDSINNLASAPTVQTPIGVPKGYVGPSPRQWSDDNATSVGTPRPSSYGAETHPDRNGNPVTQYSEGDQYAPATNSATQIASLQKDLASVGLLKKGTTFQLGTWDAASAAAYKDLLGFANQNGVTDIRALDRLKSGGGFTSVDENGNLIGIGSGDSKVSLTSPEQIKALVQSVAPSVLGKPAPQSVIDSITAHLHGLQKTAATSGTATGDDVTSAPTANSAWFEEQLKELMPQTTQANKNFGQLTGTQSLLSNPQGPLGNLT